MDSESSTVNPVQFHRNGRLLQYGAGEETGIMAITSNGDGSTEAAFQKGGSTLSTWNLDNRSIREPVLDESGTFLLAREVEDPFDDMFGRSRSTEDQPRTPFLDELERENTPALIIYASLSMREISKFRVPGLRLNHVCIRGSGSKYLAHLSQEGELVFRDLAEKREIGRLFLYPDETWLFQAPDRRMCGPAAGSRIRDVTLKDGEVRVSPSEQNGETTDLSSVFSEYLSEQDD